MNATRSGADAMAVLPYTGMTAEASSGMARIGGLLRAAGGAVFFIACANVASFLLARASARSHETSVRVALGASRGQLAQGLLSDSVLISVTGGAFGMLLALWTTYVVPALFFEQDAERLVFAPDLVSTVAVSAVCVGITIACGLVPLVDLRHDNPAAVLQRESTGPSKAMRRLRAGLVVAQMACCCVLVVSTGLLLDGFRAALQTSVGHRLGQPMLATAEARLGFHRPDLGLAYFQDLEQVAHSLPGISQTAWVGTLPGVRPAWQSMRVEHPQLLLRDVVMDVVPFTPASLAFVTMPPIAGRMFGGGDTAQTLQGRRCQRRSSHGALRWRRGRPRYRGPVGPARRDHRHRRQPAAGEGDWAASSDDLLLRGADGNTVRRRSARRGFAFPCVGARRAPCSTRTWCRGAISTRWA